MNMMTPAPLPSSTQHSFACRNGTLVITEHNVSVLSNLPAAQGSVPRSTITHVSVENGVLRSTLVIQTSSGVVLRVRGMRSTEATEVALLLGYSQQVPVAAPWATAALPPSPWSGVPGAVAGDAPTIPAMTQPPSPVSSPQPSTSSARQGETLPSVLPAVTAPSTFPASPTVASSSTTPPPWTGARTGQPVQTGRGGWRGRLRGLWGRGWAYKLAMLSVIPFLCICMCCSSSVIFAMTPYGQQLARETEATETAQVAATAQQAASSTAYALAHPNPTATDVPTATAASTDTPLPTATMTTVPPTNTPLPRPTNTPLPPPPPTPCPGVNCNPWGYNFTPGNLIHNPPSAFCAYFNCISNFWNGSGYVVECVDGMYSKSGGLSGACSRHGGEWRPLYSH